MHERTGPAPGVLPTCHGLTLRRTVLLDLKPLQSCIRPPRLKPSTLLPVLLAGEVSVRLALLPQLDSILSGPEQ